MKYSRGPCFSAKAARRLGKKTLHLRISSAPPSALSRVATNIFNDSSRALWPSSTSRQNQQSRQAKQLINSARLTASHAMDYSSLPNDPDHPVGSSPWQSSPQPTSRPSFTGSETGSTPSSPLARHAPYSTDTSQGIEGGSSDQDNLDEQNVAETRQPSSSKAARINGNRQVSHDDMQSPPLTHQPPQPQPQHYAREPQSQQQKTGPNRYHGGANRSATRQNLPQYKLQAKITSLERTGRKDPVLRFDVHVRSLLVIEYLKILLISHADKSS